MECKYAGDVHRIVDDQIHSDLARIPLDRDWAAFSTKNSKENQPAEKGSN